MSHNCMATGCTEQVAYHLLMCRTHWRLVSPSIKDQVYAAWRNGAGAGTPEHQAAVRSAIASVDAKRPPGAKP